MASPNYFVEPFAARRLPRSTCGPRHPHRRGRQWRHDVWDGGYARSRSLGRKTVCADDEPRHYAAGVALFSPARFTSDGGVVPVLDHVLFIAAVRWHSAARMVDTKRARAGGDVVRDTCRGLNDSYAISKHVGCSSPNFSAVPL